MKENSLAVSEPLICLLEATNMTVSMVAERTNISAASLRKYIKGETALTISNLIEIANFFAVPLDFLVGRCDQDTARAVLADYGKHFMILRQASWESYLAGRNRMVVKYKVEAPWPYNLLDELVEPERWTELFGADQMDGLNFSLETLPDREREAVLLYYRDGLDLWQTGDKLGISRERARQIIVKGVNKLRRPSILRYLQMGVQGAEAASKSAQYRLKLQMDISKLEARKQELTILINMLENTPGLKINKGSETEEETELALEDIPLEDLGLSVRSFNCMRRSGMKTLGDIIQFAESGKMARVRNFGKVSCREVLEKLHLLTGVDYSPLYKELLGIKEDQ